MRKKNVAALLVIPSVTVHPPRREGSHECRKICQPPKSWEVPRFAGNDN